MSTDPDPDPSGQQNDIRPSPIAGLWYNSVPQSLAQEIDSYLKNGSLITDSSVLGVIAPHAGYRYSGRTAGHAFASVSGESRDLVAILSPMHAYHDAPLLTSTHQAYATPLGKVPIDEDALDVLRTRLASVGIPLTQIAHDREHALEIELPFLQRALQGAFKLLPLMVRSRDPHLLEDLGASLVEAVEGRSVLLVGSSDLSHFYPQSIADRYDREMLRQIANFSPAGVLAAEENGTGFACGAGSVAAVLWASRQLGADTVRVLHHSTSADETGDASSVVGYGAAAILKS